MQQVRVIVIRQGKVSNMTKGQKKLLLIQLGNAFGQGFDFTIEDTVTASDTLERNQMLKAQVQALTKGRIASSSPLALVFDFKLDVLIQRLVKKTFVLSHHVFYEIVCHVVDDVVIEIQ